MAGQRTAVNLAGIEYSEIRRGMSLGAPGIFEPTQRLDARITVLPTVRPLKNRARVHFHQGTAETVAEVVPLGGSELAPGESALAQLRLEEKALLIPGDRFILRQFSPVLTIGGGRVIDPLAPRHRRNDPAIRFFLETLERGRREDVLCGLAGGSPRGLALPEILARTGWIEKEVRAASGNLTQERKLRILSEQPFTVASEEWVAKCGRELSEAVEAFHRANALLPGVPKQDLRARAGGPPPELFQAALGDLVKAGVVAVSGDLVRHAGREIALSPDESRSKELIEREFERAGLAAPNLATVLEKLPVDAVRARKILQILLREGALIQIADGLVFHRSALARLRDSLARYRIERGERLPIAAFKELAGVSRKFAIPLLEFLDREYVTRRAGDERVIL